MVEDQKFDSKLVAVDKIAYLIRIELNHGEPCVNFYPILKETPSFYYINPNHFYPTKPGKTCMRVKKVGNNIFARVQLKDAIKDFFARQDRYRYILREKLEKVDKMFSRFKHYTTNDACMPDYMPKINWPGSPSCFLHACFPGEPTKKKISMIVDEHSSVSDGMYWDPFQE